MSLITHRQAPHSDYDNYPDKDSLRAMLVNEQRGLCCYCMGRIRSDSMKVEHWKCQSRFPGDQLDYRNLLGACQGGEGQPRSRQHCDTRKGDSDLRWNPAVNPEGKFDLVFRSLIERLFVERMDQNEDIYVRYMNDDEFREVVSEWLSSQAYRRLRDAGEVPAEPGHGLRIVAGRPEERYVTCVPLVPLEVAAGAFGDPQTVEAEGEWDWVEVDTARRLRPGMFVAQVTGRSMEPSVPDGSYALFRSPVEGSRQGKTVLVQLRGTVDPETGARYTLKRYESERVAEGDSWRHIRITLKPVNPEFDPIVISGADDGELTVVAELVDLLPGTSVI